MNYVENKETNGPGKETKYGTKTLVEFNGIFHLEFFHVSFSI